MSATALLLGWLGGGLARAAARDGERTLVELAVTDSLPREQVAALASLLESELPHRGFTARVEPEIDDLRGWLSRDPDDALLRVALDAPPASGWRLVLVDAARGRAIARTLTGGVRRDRAAIEAVCDIVVSAAVALHEGLEVASQTVDEALTGQRAASPVQPTSAGSTELARSEAVARPGAPIRLEAGAGPAVATLARAAPASWGGAAAISAWFRRGGIELSAARYLGRSISSADGTFALDRTQLGLSAAAAALWRQARLTGSLGLSLDVLHRSEATPAAASVAASGSDTATRLGPRAAAAWSVSLSHRVAITWAVGIAYFPRRIRYFSTAESSAILAEPWRLTATSSLRVDVAFP